MSIIILNLQAISIYGRTTSFHPSFSSLHYHNDVVTKDSAAQICHCNNELSSIFYPTFGRCKVDFTSIVIQQMLISPYLSELVENLQFETHRSEMEQHFLSYKIYVLKQMLCCGFLHCYTLSIKNSKR